VELIGDEIRVWIIMLDPRLFAVFLAAAFLLAITPGPGIFYVLTRALTGGTREGVLSSLGTFLGGLVHVIAAALGLSAIVASSATAFLIVKYVGAIYLIWIGVRMILTRDESLGEAQAATTSTHALRQGILTELLNPKTALFFLSFLPQFVRPERGHTVLQFVVLGVVSVGLNAAIDLAVVIFAVPFGRFLRRNRRFSRSQRLASGVGMIGLGTFVAFGERK
jgi:threonine/homoserine/homoserine lactone efflux protein